MSDFLSKFDSKNYQEEKEKQTKNKENKAEVEAKKSESKETEKLTRAESRTNQKPDSQKPESQKREPQKKNAPTPPSAPTPTRGSFEETEIDPEYQNKKRKKQILFGILGVIIASLLFFLYYQSSHIAMPDFKDKGISDVNKWAQENKMKIDAKEEFSVTYDSGQVISQKVKAGKKVKKGSTVSIVVSNGADPEEIVPLPDFTKMNKAAIDKWIQENKMDGIKVVPEYSDTVEKGAYLRIEIKDTSVTSEDFKRKDYATIYVSDGKEVFEKNIVVPDFTGKMKSEVEQWTKTNSIEVTYEEIDSNTVDAEKIISQGTAANEKVAKHDSMTVTVSLGKAIIVPNFATMTADEASSGGDSNLAVTVKREFNANVPYGGLIAQSVPADTKLTSKDDLKVTVTYSEGTPFLKNYKGQVEGDLQKLFFEDYQSKGANIKYQISYVDSYETKGTVVSMTAFNEYVPMTYTVGISISLGNLTPPPGAETSNPTPDASDDEEKPSDVSE